MTFTVSGYLKLITIFYSVSCASSKEAKFTELYQAKKVTNNLIQQRKSPTLLSCTQTCLLKSNCRGFNYCQKGGSSSGSSHQQCELFSGEVDGNNMDFIKESITCSVFIKQVYDPCNHDPCQHGSKCEAENEVAYKCVDCNKLNYVGKNCEKDISFSLLFQRPSSYLSIASPVKTNEADGLTICVSFILSIVATKNQTFLQIYEQETCVFITIKINSNNLSIDIFKSSYAINRGFFIFRDFPTNLCYRWRQSDSTWSIHARGQQLISRTTSELVPPLPLWKMNFGGPSIELKNNQCKVDATQTDDQLYGKMYYIMVYSRYLSDAEILEYHNLQWTVDDSLVLTMNELKNLTSIGHGNITVEDLS